MGSRASGGRFVHDTVTRFMGSVEIAIGVQFALATNFSGSPSASRIFAFISFFNWNEF
jgi:hypothetical protein